MILGWRWLGRTSGVDIGALKCDRHTMQRFVAAFTALVRTTCNASAGGRRWASTLCHGRMALIQALPSDGL